MRLFGEGSWADANAMNGDAGCERSGEELS